MTVLSGLAAIVLYLPWLVRVPSQLARLRWAYWGSRPGLSELVGTLLDYVTGLPLPDWALPLALFLAVLITLTAVWATFRALRQVKRSGRRAAWLLGLSSGPVLLMFIVSQWQSVYLDRAMLPAGAIFVIWIAWSIGSPILPPFARRGALVAIGGAFIVGLVSFYSYRGFPYAPFGEVNAFLHEQAAADEMVLHSNKITAIPAVYDDSSIDHRYLADPEGTGSDTLAPATQEVLGLMAEDDAASVVGDAAGVWFVIFPREIEDYLSLGLEEHPALAWLQAEFELEVVSNFGELDVYHFLR
jgi:hypothetical protein